MTERYYVTDSALSERFTLYTRANVGEVFPDPVTPLTSSTGMWYAELGWRDAWERMGAFTHDEFPPDEFSQLGVVAGYCYLNASLIRLFGVRAPGLSWEDMDEQFFGAMPGVPPYEAQDGDEDLAKTQKIGETFQWALGHTQLDELDELKKYKYKYLEYKQKNTDLENMLAKIKVDEDKNLLNLNVVNESEDKIKFYQEENIRIGTELSETKKKSEILNDEIGRYENQRSDLITQINSVNDVIKDSNILTNVFENKIEPKIGVIDPQNNQNKPESNLNEQVKAIFSKKI